MKSLNLFITVVFFLIATSTVFGQQPEAHALSDEELKRANDPMANIKAFNVHNYIVSSLYGVPDQHQNQTIFRYSQPIKSFLIRASMPLITNSYEGSGPTSGFGDFNMFAIYTLPNDNGNKFGIGPNFTAPTSSHNLGYHQWQAGISVLAFLAKSKVVQYGGLLQWSGSVAPEDDQPEISIFNPQMFFIWQAGGGVCLRSTGIMTFNLRTGDYNVPIGIGVGKVIKAGKAVFNVFAEPQFTILAQGVGQPRMQTFVGFNTQF